MTGECCSMQEKALPDKSTAPSLGAEVKPSKKREPNPLDKAIEILEGYTEGTPKFESQTDHWGE